MFIYFNTQIQLILRLERFG